MSARLLPNLRSIPRKLLQCGSGIATVEFAAALPFVLSTFMVATEITNYTITKMRVSQIALQVADNGSRIGTDSLLTDPQITESDINDLLTGAGAQGTNLDLYTHGRVIISSLEAIANPNTTNQFKIRWQRCRGVKNTTSGYGVQGDTNLAGMGPAGRQVTTPDDAGVIYVQVVYDYQPLFTSVVLPNTTFNEVAAMTVRDKRDYNGPSSGTNANIGIYESSGVTASTCNLFTAT
ncbi:MAG: pilus assembly protein [Sphingobium sp.]